jgi:hypothetical protein
MYRPTIVESLVVTLCSMCLNVPQLSILSIVWIYAFCMVLSQNQASTELQNINWLIFYNGEAVCLLRGTIPIFKCK